MGACHWSTRQTSDIIPAVDVLHKIAEERIQEAQREGLFDNLSGKGRPLNLDDDSTIPEELRLTFKILKNSNCLPIEMELRKDIFNLRQLLDAAIDPETRRDLRSELNLRILRFNSLRRRSTIGLDMPQI
jgi:hypothetical protein